MPGQPGVKYQIGHRPGFTLEIVNGVEIWEDDITGGVWQGNAGQWNDELNNGMGAYDHHIVELSPPAPPWNPDTSTDEWAFVSQFYPAAIPANFNMGVPADYAVDDKPWTPGTGPQRRNYVSVPIAAWLTETDPTLRQQWLNAEISWHYDQFNRPQSNHPFQACGNNLNRRGQNCSLPNFYQHGSTYYNGWTFFDEAHADFGRMIALMALGHPVGWLNCANIARWFLPSTINGDGTAWKGQIRSFGYTIAWGLVAHLMGMGQYGTFAEDFMDGIDPALFVPKVADIMVDERLNLPWPGSDADQDGRRWPSDLPEIETGDWNGFGPQIQGSKVFMDGLQCWPLAMLIRYGLLSGSQDWEGYLYWNADRLWNQVLDPNEAGHPYTHGWTEFPDQATCQQLLDEGNLTGWRPEQTKDGNGWVCHDGSGPDRNYETCMTAAYISTVDPNHPVVTAHVKTDGSTDWGDKPQHDLATARMLEDSQGNPAC